jgi:hypothetical protein
MMQEELLDIFIIQINMGGCRCAATHREPKHKVCSGTGQSKDGIYTKPKLLSLPNIGGQSVARSDLSLSTLSRSLFRVEIVVLALTVCGNTCHIPSLLVRILLSWDRALPKYGRLGFWSSRHFLSRKIGEG